MKPIVKQVGGEWRVWVPLLGQVCLGDKVAVEGRVEVVDYDSVSDDTLLAATHIVESPGIPCEVEGLGEVDAWVLTETEYHAAGTGWRVLGVYLDEGSARREVDRLSARPESNHCEYGVEPTSIEGPEFKCAG